MVMINRQESYQRFSYIWLSYLKALEGPAYR